jgi:hypothetical protein
MTLRRGHLRVSDLVSAILNPSVLTGAFFCLLAAHFKPPGTEGIAIIVTLIGVFFTAVVPVGLLFLLKALDRLSDAEMSVRSERSRVYGLCAAGYALGAGILWIMGTPWPLWGLLVLHVPNTIVMIIVNHKMKVSIHTMVLTSLSVAALMFFGASWAPAVLLVLAAAWARWDVGNHSLAEVFCGILIGGLLTPIEICALQTTFGG